ncbi:hypothetical protein [Kitasatospora sp. MBT63]|uniref:hypothetical protein n=1 Tax=Kitasatospora sp. MBT63 TaxID=1444768 RepID=UPI00053AECFC|nr:hypothetical protein [Kitasatospora sp. MBT63]
MPATRRELTTLGESIEPAEPIAQSVQDRVRLLVASRARDPDDCQVLLEALGLAGESDPLAVPGEG